MKHCINCGVTIDNVAEVCTDCGVSQTAYLDDRYEERGENEKYCLDCGSLINKHAESCLRCGSRQPAFASGAIDSDKTTAGILALLLGVFGAHKFYQGNLPLGIVYLCFFWTGIPAALGIVEGILMLAGDDLEYKRRYEDGSLMGR